MVFAKKLHRVKDNSRRLSKSSRVAS